MQKRDDVLYAGPDYAISVCTDQTTIDTYANQQWALDSIQLTDAWDVTTGSSAVIVGVIDSGIDVTHPELDEGIVNVELSCDFLGGNKVTGVSSDTYGHGTHVAGIIAAQCNNSAGIMGACRNVTLVSLRVFYEDGTGYSSYVYNAIQYAETLNIPILNFSGRFNESSEYYDRAMLEAIENYSGLFICSAGNESDNNDDIGVYPANYNLMNIITVGACSSNNTRWNIFGTNIGSNYGANTVDVFAPGAGIYSCFPMSCASNDHGINSGTHIADGYHMLSGSSMAAPYVTAIAALMLSENPSITPIRIRQTLLENCVDHESLNDLCISGGIVNAYKSVLNSFFPTSLYLGSSSTFGAWAGTMWYTFTVPSDGTYIFYSEGEFDTIGELFHYDSGLIEYCDDIELPDDGSDDEYNFSIVATNLKAGDKIYLRVTVYNSQKQGVITVKVRS